MNFKTGIARDIGIVDSIVAEKYVPNREMNKLYASSIRDPGQTWVYVNLCYDHMALNSYCRGGKNKMIVEINGEKVEKPVTHICAYVITPIEEGKPKTLVFAQMCYDGKARDEQDQTAKDIIEALA